MGNATITPSIPIILASASKIRSKILQKTGMEFSVIISDIDEDKLREDFENKLEALMEIDICKCGFCGENLEEDSIYCSFECARADNTERV